MYLSYRNRQLLMELMKRSANQIDSLKIYYSKMQTIENDNNGIKKCEILSLAYYKLNDKIRNVKVTFEIKKPQSKKTITLEEIGKLKEEKYTFYKDRQLLNNTDLRNRSVSMLELEALKHSHSYYYDKDGSTIIENIDIGIKQNQEIDIGLLCPVIFNTFNSKTILMEITFVNKGFFCKRTTSTNYFKNTKDIDYIYWFKIKKIETVFEFEVPFIMKGTYYLAWSDINNTERQNKLKTLTKLIFQNEKNPEIAKSTLITLIKHIHFEDMTRFIEYYKTLYEL